ncbi:MAG: HDOD domain-containing protein [Planctomycetota bacterium JB042]
MNAGSRSATATGERLRVLFVDDEPEILGGLRRMLRSRRHEWDMHFVTSGEEALTAIDREPFDVVVSDMRMPGLDGPALLTEVKARTPGAVRIVLSGYADRAATMRSVTVSHQYLSKPCEAGVLEQVIERSLRLEELLANRALIDLLGPIGDLPVMPRIYRELLHALAEAEVDMQRVAEIVESDPAITAKLLQITNSSYFGLRREVSSVSQAVNYLGVQTIQDLVLTAEVFRQFESRGARGFSIEKEQTEAVLAGRVARQMFSDKHAADLAFLGGMLHDVGELILATHAPETFDRVNREAAATDRPRPEVERELLGVTHAEVGAYLLGVWGMPYPLVEAVAHHHRPSEVGETDEFGVLTAVHVAQALAAEVVDETPAELELELLERQGVLEKIPAWREFVEREDERAAGTPH